MKNAQHEKIAARTPTAVSRSLFSPALRAPAIAAAVPRRNASACTCGGTCPACQSRSKAWPISQPGDVGEIEAERIAERVIRGDSVTAAITPAAAQTGIARDTAQAGTTYAGGDVQQAIEASRGKGQRLDSSIRAAMGSRFGEDFDPVRVHTDATAASLSERLHAKAFAIGNDLYFGRDRFHPEAKEGQRLLAHELAHVVQQRGGGEWLQRDSEDATDDQAVTEDLGEGEGAEPMEEPGGGCRAESNRSLLIHNFTNLDFTVPRGCRATVTFTAVWVPVGESVDCCTGADTYAVTRNGGTPRSLPVGPNICGDDSDSHPPGVGRITTPSGRQLLHIRVDRHGCEGISMDLRVNIRIHR